MYKVFLFILKWNWNCLASYFCTVVSTNFSTFAIFLFGSSSLDESEDRELSTSFGVSNRNKAKNNKGLNIFDKKYKIQYLVSVII